MKQARRSFLPAAFVSLAPLFGTVALALPASAEPLRINGSTTVNPVVAEAAEILRAEQNMEIQVDTQGGSTGGISALGDGLVQIAMSSRHVQDGDRAKYPNVDFLEIHIGEDAVAMVVSPDVWESGMRALAKQQIIDAFENRLTNWQPVGGPDRRIAFFAREPGRGENEVFGKWLYGDPKKLPLVSHPELGGNEETRNKIGSTRGALTYLSATWADGKKVFALGIKTDSGEIVQPVSENIASGKYPMSRPLFLLTNGPAEGDAKVLVDFVLSERGQALVKKHGYLSLDQLGARSAAAK
jgi:phosphate transport system substrate-binding protein